MARSRITLLRPSRKDEAARHSERLLKTIRQLSESGFPEAKNETGLDHYQVRKWDAWHCHVTLSMLACAFLAVTSRAHRPGPALPAAVMHSPVPGKR